MDYKKLNRAARREALKNDISFSWYDRGGHLRHSRAIVEAIAGRRQFSFIH
jgi:hypothetical protein